MVVNSFLISSYAPVPIEDKITKHVVFREALFKALFAHATGPEGAGAADIPPLAGPITATEALSLSDSTATTQTGIRHHRVPLKRGSCVVCKQVTAEKRRGISIRGKNGRVLQETSPNIVNKHKDKHISRAKTGCDACKVLLCTTKGCWEAFHRDQA